MNLYESWRARRFPSVASLIVPDVPVLPAGPLYKYWPRKFISGLVRHGALRIGTLEGFRGLEDAIRGDAADSTVFFTEAQRGTQTADRLSPFARQHIRVTGDPSKVVVSGCLFRMEEVHPNAYAFCVSHELSRTAAGQYDACAEIIHPTRFFDVLTERVVAALRRSSGRSAGDPSVQVFLGKVRYMDTERDGSEWGSLNPGFVKAPRFTAEREVRCVWRCDDCPPRSPHLDIADRRLADLVRLVEIPRS